MLGLGSCSRIKIGGLLLTGPSLPHEAHSASKERATRLPLPLFRFDFCRPLSLSQRLPNPNRTRAAAAAAKSPFPGEIYSAKWSLSPTLTIADQRRGLVSSLNPTLQPPTVRSRHLALVR